MSANGFGASIRGFLANNAHGPIRHYVDGFHRKDFVIRHFFGFGRHFGFSLVTTVRISAGRHLRLNAIRVVVQASIILVHVAYLVVTVLLTGPTGETVTIGTGFSGVQAVGILLTTMGSIKTVHILSATLGGLETASGTVSTRLAGLHAVNITVVGRTSGLITTGVIIIAGLRLFTKLDHTLRGVGFVGNFVVLKFGMIVVKHFHVFTVNLAILVLVHFALSRGQLFMVFRNEFVFFLTKTFGHFGLA